MPTAGRAQGTQVAAGDARAPAPATATHAPAQQRDGGTAIPILTARIAARDSVADPLRAVLQLASSLGLRGPLGDDERDAEGSGSPMERELRDSVRQRARRTWDVKRLTTALNRFGDFLRATQRQPFRALQHAGDLSAACYNQDTLDMFAEWCRRTGSVQKGRIGDTLKSDSISTMVGAIKLLRTFEAGYTIVSAAVNVTAPAAFKEMRQGDGAPGARRLVRGLRAQHFRKLVQLGYDRSSAHGVIEWAAAIVAHNILLRGGEIGGREGKPFDAARDFTWAAIEFKAACADSAGLPWLTIDVVPCKDTHARHRACPMAVRRRAKGPVGSDPLCPYDAVMSVFRARGVAAPAVGERVRGATASEPFFTWRGGEPWDTRHTRTLAKEMFVALGLAEEEAGAKCFRIGGATDLRDALGSSQAAELTLQRGRWASDVGLVYQRALVRNHLEGSAAIGDAAGADLESMCAGWAQPATFR